MTVAPKVDRDVPPRWEKTAKVKRIACILCLPAMRPRPQISRSSPLWMSDGFRKKQTANPDSEKAGAAPPSLLIPSPSMPDEKQATR